jgi:hypothetical protein
MIPWDWMWCENNPTDVAMVTVPVQLENQMTAADRELFALFYALLASLPVPSVFWERVAEEDHEPTRHGHMLCRTPAFGYLQIYWCFFETIPSQTWKQYGLLSCNLPPSIMTQPQKLVLRNSQEFACDWKRTCKYGLYDYVHSWVYN